MFRRTATFLFALALFASVVATGAYSAAEADRAISVSVVDDDEAYVGYEPATVAVTNTTNRTATAPLVAVTNRLSTPVDLAASVDTPPGLDIDRIDDGGELASSESRPIRAEISCDAPIQDAPVTVSVTAEGDGVVVALDGTTETRVVRVSCQPG